MAYNLSLAEKVKKYLSAFPQLSIEEKKMFSGVAIMVNGKMCINISNDNLMCRFDPLIQDEILAREGVSPMIMKEKILKGYCYVSEEGFASKKDFEFWMKLCLDYNDKAKSSKKVVKKKR